MTASHPSAEPEDDEARSLHVFVLGATSALVLALHHAYRAYSLYAAPAGASMAGLGAALAGLGVGVSAAWWLAPFAESRVRGALLVAALGAGYASFAPFVAFDGPFASGATLTALGLLVGASVTAGALLHRAAARASVVLGLVSFVLAPARLAAGLAALLLVEATAARVGLLRSGICIAVLLSLAAEAYPAVRTFLHGAPEGRFAPKWTRRGAVVASLAFSLAAAESLLPLGSVARFPDELVFARHGTGSEYAVVASPVGYELYADGQLAVSPLDEARRIAALVRPALGAVSRANRVLLLYGGLGGVENELLRDPRVKELVTVTPDPARLELARSLPMLASRARGALESSRVRVVVAEPLGWLAAHPGESFDVIVADFPLPLGYREGKCYTRFAFERLERALAPEGVAVVPGVSGDALAGVVATSRSAGLHAAAYHAAVPTLGLVSYVLASRRAEPAIVTGAFGLDLGADLGAAGDGRIATLSDQWIVGAFETARERR